MPPGHLSSCGPVQGPGAASAVEWGAVRPRPPGVSDLTDHRHPSPQLMLLMSFNPLETTTYFPSL